MGFRLREEVRDALPPGLLTSAERLVILEIANDARTQTRRGMHGPDDIAPLVDMSPGAIRKHVQRIEAKGIPLRIPIGKGKDGRLVYACGGSQTNYAIPAVEVIRQAGKGGQSVHPRVDSSSSQGWTESPERLDSLSTPSRQFPSDNPSSSVREAVRDRIARVAEATDDEIDQIIEEIRKAATGTIHSLGAYMRRVTDDDIRDHATTVRAGTAQRAASARSADLEALNRWIGTLDPCDHGTTGGWYPHPDTGLPWKCALCRRWAESNPDAYTSKIRNLQEGAQQ